MGTELLEKLEIIAVSKLYQQNYQYSSESTNLIDRTIQEQLLEKFAFTINDPEENDILLGFNVRLPLEYVVQRNINTHQVFLPDNILGRLTTTFNPDYNTWSGTGANFSTFVDELGLLIRLDQSNAETTNNDLPDPSIITVISEADVVTPARAQNIFPVGINILVK